MKIFSASQIKQADQATIKTESISELNLMERAATTCVKWLLAHFQGSETFHVFCGSGNNGGDGLAIARLLAAQNRKVSVFFNVDQENCSVSTKSNYQAIEKISEIRRYSFQEFLGNSHSENDVIVDALFGIGISRKIQGIYQNIIEKINQSTATKIAIDLPSGLMADEYTDNEVIIKADHTLTFQFWKKSFLHPESGKYVGKIHVLNIGLSENFIDRTSTSDFLVNDEVAVEIYRMRTEFSHKGNFGKSVLVGGSFGKIGAAVLATKAALHAGSGLTFVVAPKCGYEILQTTCPEAMFINAGENEISAIKTPEDGVVGIGPGIGTDELTKKAVADFLNHQKNPIVLDADALNIIAENTELLQKIPANSILTPHPKEFERLFGQSENSFQQLAIARKNAVVFQIIIILKGRYTQVVLPDGMVHYNSSGNPGMAKGGSGDALTGILTALLAQKYSPSEAAIFGVWLHGKAGDFAAEIHSKEAMLPTDLIAQLGTVFKYLNKKKSI